MGKGIGQYLRHLTPVKRGDPLRTAVKADRINAIQGAIRALARGDNIMAGLNVRTRTSEDYVTISAKSQLPFGTPSADVVAPAGFSFRLSDATNWPVLQATFVQIQDGWVVDQFGGYHLPINMGLGSELVLQVQNGYWIYLVIPYDQSSGEIFDDGLLVQAGPFVPENIEGINYDPIGFVYVLTGDDGLPYVLPQNVLLGDDFFRTENDTGYSFQMFDASATDGAGHVTYQVKILDGEVIDKSGNHFVPVGMIGDDRFAIQVEDGDDIYFVIPKDDQHNITGPVTIEAGSIPNDIRTVAYRLIGTAFVDPETGYTSPTNSICGDYYFLPPGGTISAVGTHNFGLTPALFYDIRQLEFIGPNLLSRNPADEAAGIARLDTRVRISGTEIGTNDAFVSVISFDGAIVEDLGFDQARVTFPGLTPIEVHGQISGDVYNVQALLFQGTYVYETPVGTAIIAKPGIDTYGQFGSVANALRLTFAGATVQEEVLNQATIYTPDTRIASIVGEDFFQSVNVSEIFFPQALVRDGGDPNSAVVYTALQVFGSTTDPSPPIPPWVTALEFDNSFRLHWVGNEDVRISLTSPTGGGIEVLGDFGTPQTAVNLLYFPRANVTAGSDLGEAVVDTSDSRIASVVGSSFNQVLDVKELFFENALVAAGGDPDSAIVLTQLDFRDNIGTHLVGHELKFNGGIITTGTSGQVIFTPPSFAGITVSGNIQLSGINWLGFPGATVTQPIVGRADIVTPAIVGTVSGLRNNQSYNDIDTLLFLDADVEFVGPGRVSISTGFDIRGQIGGVNGTDIVNPDQLTFKGATISQGPGTHEALIRGAIKTVTADAPIATYSDINTIDFPHAQSLNLSGGGVRIWTAPQIGVELNGFRTDWGYSRSILFDGAWIENGGPVGYDAIVHFVGSGIDIYAGSGPPVLGASILSFPDATVQNQGNGVAVIYTGGIDIYGGSFGSVLGAEQITFFDSTVQADGFGGAIVYTPTGVLVTGTSGSNLVDAEKITFADAFVGYGGTGSDAVVYILPTKPSSGTFVLGCVGGALTWIDTTVCP